MNFLKQSIEEYALFAFIMVAGVVLMMLNTPGAEGFSAGIFATVVGTLGVVFTTVKFIFE